MTIDGATVKLAIIGRIQLSRNVEEGDPRYFGLDNVLHAVAEKAKEGEARGNKRSAAERLVDATCREQGTIRQESQGTI